MKQIITWWIVGIMVAFVLSIIVKQAFNLNHDTAFLTGCCILIVSGGIGAFIGAWRASA
jgi:hypothetical protein